MKTAPKKCFNQLLGAPSTRKVVEIHNICLHKNVFEVLFLLRFLQYSLYVIIHKWRHTSLGFPWTLLTKNGCFTYTLMGSVTKVVYRPNGTANQRGMSPLLYETVSSIVGLFFIIYIVNVKGLNKLIQFNSIHLNPANPSSPYLLNTTYECSRASCLCMNEWMNE